MAGRDMKVSVLVQLVDRLTAPLRGITRFISGMANSVGDLGRRIGVIGGALAALSFTAPLQAAAAWDGQLRDIAITAGKTGASVEAMIVATGMRYEKLALEVGQKSETLAKGAQLLIAAGMKDTLIDQLMPTIGRVSTAAGAAVEDAAKTAFALSETLKIKPEEMELALAKLVTAGKLGRFEFKNMASEFPGLTAQMAKLGVTGMEAVNFLGASLQTAMLGTDDPAQAANNLKNFLTKINAPEAIKKFEKELKVDVVGVMTDATAKGINPVEAVIQKMTDKMKVPKAEIDKILKQAGKSGMSDKDQEKEIRKRVEQLIQGSKVGKIFADMQVLDFLIPMLLNVEKFKEMKREIAASGIDVIANDFESRMRGLSGQMMMFGEVGTQVMRRIGLAFASNLPALNRGMIQLLKWISDIDAKWPGLIDGVLTWTGALLLLGAAIAVLTPVISALIGVVAFLASPFGIAAAAIAAAALLIWRHWETLGPFFTILFDAIKQVAQGFVDYWSGVFTGDFGRAADGVKAIWEGLQTLFSTGWQIIISMFRLALVEIDQIFGTGLAATFQNFRDRLSELVQAVMALPGQMVAAGAAIIQGLWDGMMAKFDAMLAWFKSKIDQLKSMLPSVGGPAPSTDPMGNPLGFNPTSAPGGGIGGSNGFTPRTAANSNVQVGGRIVVEAVEGSRVVNVQSENPAVPVTPNRGTVLGRA